MVVGIVDDEVGTATSGSCTGWCRQRGGGRCRSSRWSAPRRWRTCRRVRSISKEKALDGYVEYGDFAGRTAALVVIVLASILTLRIRPVRARRVRRGGTDARTSGRRRCTVGAVRRPLDRIVGRDGAFAVAPVLVDRWSKEPRSRCIRAPSPNRASCSPASPRRCCCRRFVACDVTLSAATGQVANTSSPSVGWSRPIPSSEQGYLTCRGRFRLSPPVTAPVQNGSLPIYLAISMLTVTVCRWARFASERDVWRSSS